MAPQRERAVYYNVYGSRTPGEDVSLRTRYATSPYVMHYSDPGTYKFAVTAVYNYAESARSSEVSTDVNGAGSSTPVGSYIGFDNLVLIDSNVSLLTSIAPNAITNTTSFNARVTTSAATKDMNGCTLATGTF